MSYTILVVDDEEDILDSLERQFRKNYKVLKTTSGIEALKLLQREPIHLILSDQRMPEMTGVQLFERAQKIQPDAIRMLLTGYTDIASVISAINNGQIYRYITKPWDPTELDIVVKRALETYDLKNELNRKNLDLEQALTELKTLDQAKSHFMILIGHELKTPLTTISSFVDLLKEEKLSSDIEKYVTRISQGTHRLQELVFDVLDILNAETGQMPVSKGSHRLTEVIQRAIDDLKPEATKQGVQVNVADKKTVALFDPTLISKVVKKILHNAIKFAEPDSEIKISTQSEKDRLMIWIQNQGPQISKTKIIQVLKPFNLDENIMHHTRGVGLGLAVCQSLLKRHNSELFIESEAKFTRVGFSLQIG